jgi:uncharacterized membrane protein (DUF2068 family)
MRLLVRNRIREAALLHRASRRVPWLIRLIALGQVAKGLLFLVMALITAQVAKAPDLGAMVEQAIRWFHFDPDGDRAQRLLTWTMGVSHHQLKVFAAGMFSYAAIFLIEGIGLWFDRPWAEWLVVLATGVLVPWEIEHLITKPTVGVALMLIINLAVVLFLIRRIAARRRAAVPVTVRSE